MASTPTQDIFIPNLPYPNSGIIFGIVDTSSAVCLAQAKRKRNKKKKKKKKNRLYIRSAKAGCLHAAYNQLGIFSYQISISLFKGLVYSGSWTYYLNHQPKSTFFLSQNGVSVKGVRSECFLHF